MTPAELYAIRERCEKATAGPWAWAEEPPEDDDDYPVFLTLENHARMLLLHNCHWAPAQADVDFIAHARTDIPALLAEIDLLRTELDELKHPAVTVEREPDCPDCGVHHSPDCKGRLRVPT